VGRRAAEAKCDCPAELPQRFRSREGSDERPREPALDAPRQGWSFRSLSHIDPARMFHTSNGMPPERHLGTIVGEPLRSRSDIEGRRGK